MNTFLLVDCRVVCDRFASSVPFSKFLCVLVCFSLELSLCLHVCQLLKYFLERNLMDVKWGSLIKGMAMVYNKYSPFSSIDFPLIIQFIIGIFATKAYNKDDIIYEEKPLVSISLSPIFSSFFIVLLFQGSFSASIQSTRCLDLCSLLSLFGFSWSTIC